MDLQAVRSRLWVVIACLVLTGMGCTHVVSETLRQQAQPPVPFAELRANPEALKGRTVIMGGEILQTTNLRDATRIEVLQRPLNVSESPQLTDATGGRFMALCNEYLDPAVYAQHRRITVAGQVMGTYEGKVGEADYSYPLISCEETHVFPSAATELLKYAANPWWYPRPYYYPWVVGAYPYTFWGPYWRYW
jgi:outer membrane lipoprotein